MFRMSSLMDSTVPLVAALFADFDLRDSGSVYYRVSQDNYILDEVAERIVSLNPSFNGFHPTLSVIATWTQAVLFSDAFLDTQVHNIIMAL